MKKLDKLMMQNRQWAEEVCDKDPAFFERGAKQQSPEYLWVGCSDSRVPANQILGLLPGDVFVHRNIANVAVHSDLNFLSVLQYAVEVLKVKHVLVCGHYGCGGVKAAIEHESYGLIDNWLRHIQDVEIKHHDFLNQLFDDKVDVRQKHALMCELNVVEQAVNIARTSIVEAAWKKNQPLAIHALIYGLSDGKLRQIAFGVEASKALPSFYQAALEEVRQNARACKA